MTALADSFLPAGTRGSAPDKISPPAVAIVNETFVRTFGLGPDPSVLGGAIVVIAVVVLGASYLPALRASRVEPMEALRHD